MAVASSVGGSAGVVGSSVLVGGGPGVLVGGTSVEVAVGSDVSVGGSVVGGSGVSVGCGVCVGTVGVGVLDGGRVVGVNEGVRVVASGLGVNVGTGVEVGAGPSGRDSRVAVGLKRKPNNENGVDVVWTVDTARSVTAMVGVGLEPSLPVTGITIGLGIISPIILAARATAVLFILPYDRSWVLRA